MRCIGWLVGAPVYVVVVGVWWLEADDDAGELTRCMGAKRAAPRPSVSVRDPGLRFQRSMNYSPTPKLPWTPKTVRARLFGDGELGAGDDCLPGALVFVQRLDGGLAIMTFPPSSSSGGLLATTSGCGPGRPAS